MAIGALAIPCRMPATPLLGAAGRCKRRRGWRCDRGIGEGDGSAYKSSWEVKGTGGAPERRKVSSVVSTGDAHTETARWRLAPSLSSGSTTCSVRFESWVTGSGGSTDFTMDFFHCGRWRALSISKRFGDDGEGLSGVAVGVEDPAACCVERRCWDARVVLTGDAQAVLALDGEASPGKGKPGRSVIRRRTGPSSSSEESVSPDESDPLSDTGLIDSFSEMRIGLSEDVPA